MEGLPLPLFFCHFMFLKIEHFTKLIPENVNIRIIGWTQSHNHFKDDKYYGITANFPQAVKKAMYNV